MSNTQQIEISRTFLCAKQVGEKRGRFQFVVEIAHKKVILILISLYDFKEIFRQFCLVHFSMTTIDNLKQCSYLKCSYLKMCSLGNAFAVSFFRCRARLRSRAFDFHYSSEKRCGKLGRYFSFNEIHVLYNTNSRFDLYFSVPQLPFIAKVQHRILY